MTTTNEGQRDSAVAHHVSNEVRAWLGRRRRTQSDLARHMGIAKSAVSVRLNGSREFSISELVEIAAWLDISLADLLGPELLQARRSPRGDMVTAGAEGKEWALWGSNPRPMDYQSRRHKVSPAHVHRATRSCRLDGGHRRTRATTCSSRGLIG